MTGEAMKHDIRLSFGLNFINKTYCLVELCSCLVHKFFPCCTFFFLNRTDLLVLSDAVDLQLVDSSYISLFTKSPHSSSAMCVPSVWILMQK